MSSAPARLSPAARVASRVPRGADAVLAAALALTFAFFVWTAATSEPFRFVAETTDPYNDLADALLHGQAALQDAPAELVALENPYDPDQNGPYKNGIHDLSLYEGRLYAYWGPTPAVVLFAPFRALTGVGFPQGLAVALFGFLGLLAAVLVLRLLVRRLAGDAPSWMIVVAVIGLALGTTLPFVLRRPVVYEVAITAGMCFTWWGIYLVLSGALRERPSLPRLALASMSFGLAFNARPTHLLTGGILFATFVVLARRAPGIRGGARLAVALGAPFVVAGLLAAAYNFARFESPTEFGQRYQLAGIEVREKEAFKASFLAPGLYNYVVAPPRPSFAFPYLQLPPPPSFPGELPDGYDGTTQPAEPTGGLLPMLPIVVFALALPLVWRRARAHARGPAAATAGIALLGAAMLLLVSLALWGTTQRYVVDFALLFAVPAATAWIVVARGSRAARVAGVAALAWGAICGVALSFTGYYDALRGRHPETYRQLERITSPLPTVAAAIGGGPRISRIDAPTGYSPPEIDYAKLDVEGASFGLGEEGVVLTVVSPGDEVAILDAVVAPGPGVAPEALGRLVVAPDGAPVRRPAAPRTPRVLRLRVPVDRGINRVRLAVTPTASGAALAEETRKSGLLTLERVEILR